MMRKILSVLLAIALLCALCACGGQTQAAPEAPAEEKTAPAVPAAPAPQPEVPAPAPEDPVEEPAEAPAEPAPQEEPAAAPAAPADQPADKPAPAAEPEKPAETPVKPAGDPKAIAQGLVGRPVSELYAAIGQPLSADYAPSCLIDGDDGELTYDGFVVYTERGADYETVYAVM